MNEMNRLLHDIARTDDQDELSNRTKRGEAANEVEGLLGLVRREA